MSTVPARRTVRLDQLRLGDRIRARFLSGQAVVIEVGLPPAAPGGPPLLTLEWLRHEAVPYADAPNLACSRVTVERTQVDAGPQEVTLLGNVLVPG